MKILFIFLLCLLSSCIVIEPAQIKKETSVSKRTIWTIEKVEQTTKKTGDTLYKIRWTNTRGLIIEEKVDKITWELEGMSLLGFDVGDVDSKKYVKRVFWVLDYFLKRTNAEGEKVYYVSWKSFLRYDIVEELYQLNWEAKGSMMLGFVEDK